MNLNESSFPGHAQKERERKEEDGKFHREKFGEYCPLCGAGEFDSRCALNRHMKYFCTARHLRKDETPRNGIY